MGQGRIVTHIADGLYTVELNLRRDRINNILANLATTIDEKKQQIESLERAHKRSIDEIDTAGKSEDSFIDKDDEDASGILPPLLFDGPALIAAINQERTSRGIPALNTAGTLNQAAEQHAIYCREADLLVHTGRGGTTVEERYAAAGYPGAVVGESVLGGQVGTVEVLEAIMSHPGYRQEALERDFTDIGVGFAYDGGSTYAYFYVIAYGGP